MLQGRSGERVIEREREEKPQQSLLQVKHNLYSVRNSEAELEGFSRSKL